MKITTKEPASSDSNYTYSKKCLKWRKERKSLELDEETAYESEKCRLLIFNVEQKCRKSADD